MNSYELDPRVDVFRRHLTGRARDAVPPFAHAHLIKALDRGWDPKTLAGECSRDLPDQPGAVIQRRLAWMAEHDPPDKPTPVAPGVRPDGCEHTTDPNGWLMDPKTGDLTGKCPCWTTTLKEQPR